MRLPISFQQNGRLQRALAQQASVFPISPLAEAALLFFIFTAFLARVQFATTGLAGTDGYYHIKMGYLMRHNGLTPLFNHLPFTILNEAAYYDHHMLFHAWLALFATADPAVDAGVGLTQGAKLAAVLMASFAFVAVWGVLKSERVPFAGLWALALLALSDAFLYRMHLPRAQSLSLLLLMLGVYLLLKERFRYLIPLGFLFVWAYNAFPLLAVVGGVYLIATLMTERRFVWQAMVYPLMGIGLGLLINPYFPENMTFIVDHLAPKLGESTTRVGNEWSPYRTWTLVENSAGTLALLALGAFAVGWRAQRMEKRTLFAFGLTLVFGYLLLESRRFIEYFPPMVLLFGAFAYAPFLRERAVRIWLDVGKRRLGVTAVILVLLAIPTARTQSRAIELMQRSKPANQYADAALWLRANAPREAQIFQTDWDDFTRLFFYNSDARYTAGLDPTFMQLYDSELFEQWVAITQGKGEMHSEAIRTRFNADYVFTDLNHKAFIADAEADPGLDELYRDAFAIIFEVVE